MSEEIKSDATVTTPEETAQPERTFTQAELDAIVSERLMRERAKYSDYEDLKTKAAAEEANKSDLEKATERAKSLQEQLDALTAANEARDLRERISEETGVPAKLLRGNSEEDLRTQAQAIMGFAKANQTYPSVKDGGEATTPTVSKADILAIKDEKKRLEAIKQNIDLFN